MRFGGYGSRGMGCLKAKQFEDEGGRNGWTREDDGGERGWG